MEIPDSVTEIGEETFYKCTGLTSVEIPDSVKHIGRSAFEYCRGLTSVIIPDSVTEIGKGAFEDCYALREVHCRIKKIKDVSIEEDDWLESIWDSGFLRKCTLYVPIGTGYAYRHHPVFSEFKEVVIEK